MARATPMARPAMMKFQRNYSDHNEETFEEFTTRYVNHAAALSLSQY